MTHSVAVHIRPESLHAFRLLVGAAFSACVVTLVCAAAVVNGAPTPVVSSPDAAGAALAAPATAVESHHVDTGAGSGKSHHQFDNDIAVRPQVDGIDMRHALRKPRRSNRRLRVPGRDRANSGATRAVTSESGTTQLTLKQKRMSKRALMRRLMTVRGGLQA